jgi:DNA replication protein DnaC
MKDDDLIGLTVEKLRWLRLPGMARALSDIIEAAREQNLSPLDVVSRIADEEKASRLKSAVERRVRDARFPEINTIDGFDFDFDPLRKKLKASIPRPARSRLHRQGRQSRLHR